MITHKDNGHTATVDSDRAVTGCTMFLDQYDGKLMAITRTYTVAPPGSAAPNIRWSHVKRPDSRD